MRFIHSKTLEFHEFFNHKDISYAILSHTWGGDEVLFQDLDSLTIDKPPDLIKQKAGYKKIQACCAQADSDGFEYIWVDTCCIDKRSSAELSEAINSMYRWYQDSTVCYAYLSDVPNGLDSETQMTKFKESRWFTRGWTLQELIAPRNLEFYGDQWHIQGQGASLGTKRRLRHEISEITNIPVDALMSHESRRDYSVAQKMSWASQRKTTRTEDIAYCLMGLFNVNMPLLYGEVERAFVRLQEEIMKVSNDETIFTWTNESTLCVQGLLATSPAYFAKSGNFIQADEAVATRAIPFTATHLGLHMEIFLPEAFQTPVPQALNGFKGRSSKDSDIVHVAILNCREKDTKRMIGIYLLCTTRERPVMGSSTYIRINSRSIVNSHRGLFFADLNNYESMKEKSSSTWLGMNIPFELNRTSIFAKLVGPVEPGYLSLGVRPAVSKSWLWQRYQLDEAVCIRICPKDFRIIETWPKGEQTKRDQMTMLAFKSFNPEFWNFTVSFQDQNGQDAFHVRLQMDGRASSVRLQHLPTAKEYGHDITHYSNLQPRGDDYSALELHSGRIASVSCRLQQIGKILGCGLFISVTEAA